MRRLVLLLLLLTAVLTYLELPLKRIPDGHRVTDLEQVKCQEGQEEVCFQKDIAYCVQLIHNQNVHLMAVDFTIPISWIKSSECQVNGGSKCKLIEHSLNQNLKASIKTLKNKLRRKGTDSYNETPTSSQNLTLLSMHSITGRIEKGQNVEFWTRDSNKLVSLYKLFLVGVFLSGEKDKMDLKNTNFVNATQITSHTDRLSDGAISVRFDGESENSFLYEIFEFVGEQEKTMTIYLGPNSTITLGDLSTKNAQLGYSSIIWLPLNTKRELMIDQITFQTIGSQKVTSFESSYEAVFTLSASYIALPGKLLQQVLKHLDSVSKCSLEVNKFIICSKPSKTFWSKRLILEILEAKVVLEMEQLVRFKKGNQVVLHIRQSEDDHIIVGEPFFKKYFSAFDYQKNRIGIAQRRKSEEQKILDVITLVRFLTVIFIGGCSFIVCYRPVKRILKVSGLYKSLQTNQNHPTETRRLKYSNIQTDTAAGYDQLNRHMKNVLDVPVEGI